jgi:hypothetical protein
MEIPSRHFLLNNALLTHYALITILTFTSCTQDTQMGPRPDSEHIVQVKDIAPPHADEPSTDGECAATAQVTWLGVTNYVIRYPYQGRTISIFLDHQINGHEYGSVLNALDIEHPDLVVIGHDHFDHNGECLSEGRWFCTAVQWKTGSPETPWKSSPVATLPNGRHAPLLLAPYGICARSGDTTCMPTLAEHGRRTYDLPKLGLRITIVPSVHSLIYGWPDTERDLPEEGGLDTYTFLFEFPAAHRRCRPSMLWANSTFQEEPFLDFNQTLETQTGTITLNYRHLLEEAVATLGKRRVGLWATYAHHLPSPEALSQWMNVIRPLSWTNHHHGTESSTYFPELATTFPGHPLGGPKDDPTSPWLPKATLEDSRFLPLEDYWQTFDLTTQGAALNPLETDLMRKKFRALHAMP